MRSPIRTRRYGAGVIAATAVIIGVMVGAAPAAAHANLVATSPTQGAQLDTAPESVSFTMDEPVQLVPGSVALISADNDRLTLGEPSVSADRTQIKVAILANLTNDVYLATVRAVSADTHVVAYSIRFTVGDVEDNDVNVGRPIEYGQAGGSWTIAIEVARVLGYSGAVLSVGLLVAMALAGTPGALAGTRTVRRLTSVALLGCLLVAVGAVFNLTVQGPYAQGSADWTSVLRFEGLSATSESPLGVRLLIRLGVVLLLMCWVIRRRIPWRPTAVPLTAGALISYTFAAGGHAATGVDSTFAVVSTTTHVLAMTIWIGGVVALVVGGRSTLAPRPWAVVASSCLALVLATGIYQAARRVYPVDSLWRTDYGLILLGKVTAVIAVVVFAFWARRWLGSRAGGPWPVYAELVAGAVVLALTTVLASSVPARDDYGPALTATARLERGTLTVHADTTRRGPVTVRLEPDAAARRTVTAISATLSSRTAGVARLPVQLTERHGRWTSENVIIPTPAEWTLSIVVDDGTSPVVTAVRYVVW
ncbi:copper resistance protein CopC [Gordonia sp. CPCC 206044]|uniref:copper resistance CopC/CopD family protein n=1 Tax=Gordonia sp. CPCC 206044 TaxID=3140793 RepID=UPI003AF37157